MACRRVSSAPLVPPRRRLDQPLPLGVDAGAAGARVILVAFQLREPYTARDGCPVVAVRRALPSHVLTNGEGKRGGGLKRDCGKYGSPRSPVALPTADYSVYAGNGTSDAIATRR